MNLKKPLKGPNKIIYDVLSESAKPMGAYEILERVKVHGINGPPTIYRALDKLVKLGVAHRIASTHTYVMCRHNKEHAAEAVVFAVCYLCDNVNEIPNKAIRDALDSVKASNSFKVKSEIIEIIGTCKSCTGQKGTG